MHKYIIAKWNDESINTFKTNDMDKCKEKDLKEMAMIQDQKFNSSFFWTTDTI